ncbi:hypothetical protein CFC21_090069 [Triticum aestivum]|uniref:Uncharacterized protein n=2 Tax=Triticum aestivum TaxID=4565 RepID=A0A3B6PRX1_WHEAT|nr:hypothetical protein CFC21_090069 [Triticum aestivum]
MATARCAGRWSAPALLLLLLLLLCAVALVAVVPLAALPGGDAAAGGRRALVPAARSGRFRPRPRRWNSAGLVDSKHEVPSGPNPDSNR